MRFKLVVSIAFLMFSINALCQDKPKLFGEDSFLQLEDFYTGGNFGLQFGNSTYINISPLLGYKVNDKFSIGLGGTYIYFGYRDNQVSFSDHIAGWRLFARHVIYENFFAYTEYESMTGQWLFNEPRSKVESLFIGGGYSQSFGGLFSGQIMLLYNLNDTYPSPYATNPIIRIGINAGL